MSEKIELERQGARGRYLMSFAGGEKAELTFTEPEPGHMVVDHTYVPSSQRGKGIAGALVRKVIEDARANGARITPLCSYVAAEFRRHPEWSDLLKS